MSPLGVDMHVRINSTSCKRSNAKCRDGFSSKIYTNQVSKAISHRVYDDVDMTVE